METLTVPFTLPYPVHPVTYFLALVYCFFGIAIISDTFMSAIEVITSKKTNSDESE